MLLLIKGMSAVYIKWPKLNTMLLLIPIARYIFVRNQKVFQRILSCIKAKITIEVLPFKLNQYNVRINFIQNSC